MQKYNIYIRNALDANAHSIDIKLVDNGLNLIQVTKKNDILLLFDNF